jgi:hypothetical protein
MITYMRYLPRRTVIIFLAASAASGLDIAQAKQTLASQQDVLQNPVAAFLYIFIIALCFQRY